MLPLPVRDGRSRADSLDCENNGHSERARKTMRKAKTGYSVNLAGKAGSAQAQQFLSDKQQQNHPICTIVKSQILRYNRSRKFKMNGRVDI